VPELPEHALRAAERREPVVRDSNAGKLRAHPPSLRRPAAASLQYAPLPVMTTPTVLAMMRRSRLSDQEST
jgi:hypothetical protein